MAQQLSEQPLRSNARRNRERILEVAHEALTESSDASLNSIAKQADVGIATLYRHFPTREALVLAVYDYEVRQVVEAVPRLLAKKPAIEALRVWMLRLAQYGMTKHGLAAALAASGSGTSLAARDRILAALALLLRACEEDGSISPGTDPEDFLLAMTGLFRMDPGGEWRAQAKRLIALILDGVRSRA